MTARMTVVAVTGLLLLGACGGETPTLDDEMAAGGSGGAAHGGAAGGPAHGGSAGGGAAGKATGGATGPGGKSSAGAAGEAQAGAGGQPPAGAAGEGGQGPGGGGQPGGSGGSGQTGGSGGSGGAWAPGGAGGAGGGGTGGAGGSSAVTKCQKPIVPGLNTGWTAYGMKRAFYADFPESKSKAPALAYSFHGFKDTPANWRSALALDPDTDPDFPLIVITPDDTDLQPINAGNVPQGLDWDLSNGKHTLENRDVELVLSIKGCLIEQESIDTDRVYSVGFSAGSVFSSLLHSRFQQDFAAVVTMSGLWFNDPAERKLINPLIPINVAWDDLNKEFGGTVLMSHGGNNDVIGALGLQVVNLEQTAQKAIPFLQAGGRAVIDCPHQGGHIPSPTVKAAQIVSFFKSHKLGEKSPYLTGGLEASLSGICTLHKPD